MLEGALALVLLVPAVLLTTSLSMLDILCYGVLPNGYGLLSALPEIRGQRGDRRSPVITMATAPSPQRYAGAMVAQCCGQGSVKVSSESRNVRGDKSAFLV
jgi:hypothetical protein